MLIHDPNGEAIHARGAIVTSDRGQLLELLVRPGPVRVCWRGAVLQDREGRLSAFEWANRCAMAAGGLLVIWDEVDRFTEGGRLTPAADVMVNAGRHRGLRVFACARRPYRVARDVTANATRIIAFSTTEPRDIAYLEDHIGQAARQLATLPRFHALDWTEAGASVKKAPFI